MPEPLPPTRARLAGYFLRLGATGFGGPIVLVDAMHRDLVATRRWVSEAEFREGLALAQVAPGPLAAQLCFYLGFLRGGFAGAALAGAGFILPSFLMVTVLGWGYLRFGGLPWMQRAFYGIGAAVIGLVARSAQRLTTRTLGRDPLLWGIALVLAAVTARTGRENLPLILLAGLLAWVARDPPRWLRRQGTAYEAASLLLLLQLLGFFVYAGSFVFGSGLAIVPFLHGGVVLERHWLSERQFLDAVAVALITPGPVVITAGFIGYLVAGPAGACVAAAATFLPCFLLTVTLAAPFHRYGQLPRLRLVVGGITAAATGTIVGAVAVLGRQSPVDRFTVGLALLVFGLTWLRWRIPEPVMVLGAALAGVLARHAT
jgi:chromate transporter